MNYWEHYSHEADIGIRGSADSLASAFEQAALALTAVIANPNKEIVDAADKAGLANKVAKLSPLVCVKG